LSTLCNGYKDIKNDVPIAGHRPLPRIDLPRACFLRTAQHFPAKPGKD